MSDFCDFVPDDPSCQTEPEPVDPVDGGDGGDMKDMDDTNSMDDGGMGAMYVNLQYLRVAVMGAIFPAVWMFRYRANDAIKDYGKTATDTNYYLLLDNLANYS